MIKRNTVTTALLAAGTAISLIGCGSGTAGTASVQGTQTREMVLDHFPGQSPEGETHIMVDHAGREVEIPAEINRIVISSLLPLPSAYNLFEGSAGKLVSIHPSSMATAENSILPKVAPDILDVDTGFLQGEELDIEELLNLKPNVMFYSANNTEEYERLAAADIPAVGFSASNWDFDCVATFESWVKLLGRIPGREDKAARITDYEYQIYDEIQTVLNGAGGVGKPRVLILFNYANGVIRTSGSNFFGQYWIESTSSVNVAANLTGTPEINMEQIHEWDPDIIYVTSFSPYLLGDLYDNTIGGHDWSNMKTVKEGKVYKFPLSMYRWFPPALDTSLVLGWLTQENQPRLFADMDVEQEARTYYERFYNMALLDEDITQTFSPAGEAARN